MKPNLRYKKTSKVRDLIHQAGGAKTVAENMDVQPHAMWRWMHLESIPRSRLVELYLMARHTRMYNELMKEIEEWSKK